MTSKLSSHLRRDLSSYYNSLETVVLWRGPLGSVRSSQGDTRGAWYVSGEFEFLTSNKPQQTLWSCGSSPLLLPSWFPHGPLGWPLTSGPPVRRPRLRATSASHVCVPRLRATSAGRGHLHEAWVTQFPEAEILWAFIISGFGSVLPDPE